MTGHLEGEFFADAGGGTCDEDGFVGEKAHGEDGTTD
jgi:hypothetical protein